MSNLGETGCFVAVFTKKNDTGRVVAKFWRWRVAKRGAPFVLGQPNATYSAEQIPVEILRVVKGGEGQLMAALGIPDAQTWPFIRIVGRDRVVYMGPAPTDGVEIDKLLDMALRAKHAEQGEPS